MSHPSDPLFERMREVVEASSYHLLKHFKDDFYKHDRQQLRETFAPQMAYLWIVRMNGTHLVPLYIDNRYSTEATAALQMNDGNAIDIFIISEKGVRKITPIQAAQELTKFDYEVQNGFVMKKGGSSLGFVEIDISYEGGQQQATVHYSADASIDTLTERDRVALCRIGLAQAISATQSLFIKVRAIAFNNDVLFPLVGEPVKG